MESRIDSIRFYTAPKRKKPQAGDEKVVKGVTMIRQQRRVPPGLPHAGAHLVSNGRPVWEWVVKDGPKDRRRPFRKTPGDGD